MRASEPVAGVTRTPIFPFRDKDNRLLTMAELSALIEPDQLKELISMTSPSLVSAIDAGRDAEKVQEKVSLYRLRSAQRCVPFAAFAQLSVIPAKSDEYRVTLVETPSGPSRDAFAKTHDETDSFAVNGTLQLRNGYFTFWQLNDPAPRTRVENERLTLVAALAGRKRITRPELAALPPFVDADIQWLVEQQILIPTLEDPPISMCSFSLRDEKNRSSRIARRLDAEAKTSNITSYADRPPFSLANECLEYAASRTTEAAIKTRRPSPVYGDFIEYFRRLFNEGPISLLDLAGVLDQDWRRYVRDSASTAEQNNHGRFIADRLMQGSAVTRTIDISDLASPVPQDQLIEGSAVVTLADCRQDGRCTTLVRQTLLGTGVEFLGRFVGDSPDIDARVSSLVDDYIGRHVGEEVVELHYRPTGRIYNIMNRGRVFAKRLLLVDRFPTAAPEDYYLGDIEAYLFREQICFRRVIDGHPIRLVLPNAINYMFHTHAPLFLVLAACCRRQLAGIVAGTALERLSYIPRIVCGEDLWIQPRTWRLPPTDRASLEATSRPQRGEWLKRWLTPRLDHQDFELAQNDQQLTFNIDDTEALSIAANQMAASGGAITECFSGQHLLPPSPDGMRFNNQIVVALGGGSIARDEGRASTLSIARLGTARVAQSTNNAANPRWLYYEVYCSAAKMEPFLLHYIAPLQRQLAADELLRRWFFIRYWENGPHLRIRLEVSDIEDRWHVAELLEKRLFLTSALREIADWQAKPFIPEVMRYNEALVDVALDWFNEDSDLALQHFQQVAALEREDRMVADVAACAARADTYLRRAKLSYDQRLAFARNMTSLSAGVKGGLKASDGKRASESLYDKIKGRADEVATSRDEFSSYQIESFVHMTANRNLLRWDPVRELDVWRCLRRAYERDRVRGQDKGGHSSQHLKVA